MSYRLENTGSGAVRLHLEGEITIESAGELKQALLQALESGSAVVLDFGAATALDLAALQLLCAAHRTAVTRGGDLGLEGEEELIRRTVDEAGFRRQCACVLSSEKANCLWLSRRAG